MDMDTTKLPWGHEWIISDDKNSRSIVNSTETAQKWLKPLTGTLIELLKPEWRVIDIGAHHGYFSMLMSTLVKEVVSFEPSPREYRRLLAHIEHNKIENIIPVNLALCKKTGIKTFHMTTNDETGCSSLHPAADLPTKEVKVMGCNPNDIITFSADFVKIDAEGAELEILQNMLTLIGRCRPIMVIEIADNRTEPWGYKSSDIIDFLRDVPGYTCLTTDWKLLDKKIHGDIIAVPDEHIKASAL